MPSGQAVPMLTFIADSVPALTATQHAPSAQAAVGQVLASCLVSVRVELIPAPNLAQAVSNLLTTSLRPVLQPLLEEAVGLHASDMANQGKATDANSNPAPQHAQHRGTQQGSSSNTNAQHAQHGATGPAVLSLNEDAAGKAQLLECLLRLYQGAVQVHGECAAMQPQVDPLTGQGIGLPNQGSSQGAPQGSCTLTDKLCHYSTSKPCR